MKRVSFDPSWPESVKTSHFYDELEFWQSRSNLGYTYGYENRFKITIDLVKKAAAAPARVLDLAAAQGNFSLTLAEMGYQVVWNDLRAELVDYVRQKYEFGSIDYRPGNVFDLQIEEIGYFDVIVAAEIIEHVAHPDQFLKKLSLLLKPGGTIVLTTPNGGYIRNGLPRFSDCPDPSIYESVQFGPNSDGHIFLPYADELEVWAKKADLKLEHLILFGNSLTKGHAKTGALLPFLPKSLIFAIEKLTRTGPKISNSRLNSAMAASLTRSA
ncbi:methyltransferase domain-containing protein [Granulicella sp. dw_53]|uniref:class I SAM-dependent methyltransferase n=1 Tax=Granulicella sp. dw_53 TaxID=2719792 RepID=UPI001BD3D5E3